MTEKEKLLENLMNKTGKSHDELSKLILDKVDELSGLVSEEGAIYIVASDLGVKLDQDKPKIEANLMKIDEITNPKTPVSLNVKVIRKYDKVSFSSKNGGEGEVQSILVGDETGIIRIVFWNDKTQILDNVQELDNLKIINAYTRENTNQERIEVHYGQYSDIEVNPKGVEIELKEWTPQNIESVDKKIIDVEDGDRNVKFDAIITDFEIPRFYLGCPECFKKVMQDDGVFSCAEHGAVQAQKIPIINLVIDDSSAIINLVAFRDRAENLTKLDSKEIISLTENIEKFKEFSKTIVGSKISVVGNINLNNMTSEKQFILNQVLSIDFSEKLDKSDKNLEKDNSLDNQNDEDFDIEEIDIEDEDLM